jgi:hypothetical protein
MSIFSVSRSIRSSRRAWLLAAGVGIAALAWGQIGLAQSGGPFGWWLVRFGSSCRRGRQSRTYHLPRALFDFGEWQSSVGITRLR